MMIFDTHAHYDDKRFNADREDLLKSLPGFGVCNVINAGADLRGSKQGIALADEYDYIYVAVGIHPHYAESELKRFGSLEKIREEIINLASHKKVVAIGECGLDYYRNLSPKSTQAEIFRLQLLLAVELDLPVIIHDRDAHKDTLDILKQYKLRGVMHCFSGSVEMMNELIAMNFHVGIGGVVTFKNSVTIKEVARQIPLERLLLETDAPYLAPEPHRGERCNSGMIKFVAEEIADLRGVKSNEILEKTCENAKKLFKIL